MTLLQWFDLERHLIFIVMVFSDLTAAVYFERVVGVVAWQLDHIGIVRQFATVLATRTFYMHAIAHEWSAVLT